MGDRGAEGSGGLGLKLLGRVPRGSLVVTDGNPAYDGALAGWARHEAVRAGDPSTANIGMVNSLHSRLRAFLAPMRGVSARRLQRSTWTGSATESSSSAPRGTAGSCSTGTRPRDGTR